MDEVANRVWPAVGGAEQAAHWERRRARPPLAARQGPASSTASLTKEKAVVPGVRGAACRASELPAQQRRQALALGGGDAAARALHPKLHVAVLVDQGDQPSTLSSAHRADGNLPLEDVQSVDPGGGRAWDRAGRGRVRRVRGD